MSEEEEKKRAAEFKSIIDTARLGYPTFNGKDSRRLAECIDGYRETVLDVWTQFASSSVKKTGGEYTYHNMGLSTLEEVESILQGIGWIDENGVPVPKEKRP